MRTLRHSALHRRSRALAVLVLAGLLLGVLPALADDYESRRMNDAVLELKVKTALLGKIGLDAMDMDVTAIGNRIVLNGEAESKTHQELAKEVALAVDGVDSVVNQVRVETDGEEETETPVADNVGSAVSHAELEIKDAVLESRVKTKLIEELGLTAFDIEVEATDGTVSLRGTLKDRDRVKLAKKIARDVRGVDKLVDLLEVAKK